MPIDGVGIEVVPERVGMYSAAALTDEAAQFGRQAGTDSCPVLNGHCVADGDARMPPQQPK